MQRFAINLHLIQDFCLFLWFNPRVRVRVY